MKTLIKKAIAALVCIMMVAATFPVHMLNSAVFATDNELDLTLPKDMKRLKDLTESDLKDIKTINLALDRDWNPGVETFKSDGSGGLISSNGEVFVIENVDIGGKNVQRLVLKEDFAGGTPQEVELESETYAVLGDGYGDCTEEEQIDINTQAGEDIQKPDVLPEDEEKPKQEADPASARNITDVTPVSLEFPNDLKWRDNTCGLFKEPPDSIDLVMEFPNGQTWGLSVTEKDDDDTGLEGEVKGGGGVAGKIRTKPKPKKRAYLIRDSKNREYRSSRRETGLLKGGSSKKENYAALLGSGAADHTTSGETWTSSDGKTWNTFSERSFILSDGTVLILDESGFKTPSGEKWTEIPDGSYKSPTGQIWKEDMSANGISFSCSGKTLYVYPAITLEANDGERCTIIHYDIDVWKTCIGRANYENALMNATLSFNVDPSNLGMSKDYLFDFSDSKFAGKTINFKSSDGKTKKINMPNSDIGLLKAADCTVNFEGIESNGGQDYTDYVYQNPQDLKNPLTKDLISVKNCELSLGKGTVVENFVGLFACAIGSENSRVTMTGGAKVCNCASYGFFDYSKPQTGVSGGGGLPTIPEEGSKNPKSLETTRGGAIRLLNNSTLVLNGCLIDKCSCFSNRRACGGAIYSSDSFIEFLKGTISNSRSVSGSNDPYGRSYGGGIYAQRSKLNFQNGQISRCRAIETEGINARRKGDAICLAFGCTHTFSDAFRITLHEDDENDLHNLDEKITGRVGVYIFGLENELESYYEVPIEGQDPIYIHKDQLESPLLPILKDKLVRAEDGAVFLEAEIENGDPITEKTTLKDILSSDYSNITQKLVPTYDESEMHVSTYYMLQKAIYGANGDRRIILDSNIFIDENCKAASEIEEFDGVEWEYCFSDNRGTTKNITLESKDADEPNMIKIKNSDFGLFAMQNGTLTLKNIKLDGGNFNSEDEQGDFISISKKSVLNLEEGTLIQNVYKNSFYVIYLNGGELNINGAYITGCGVVHADKPAYGGAVYSRGGKILMNSGGIVDCFAAAKEQGGKAFGGAICATNKSFLDICGGVIEGCYVQDDQSVANVKALGDAIYFDDDEGGGYCVVPPNGDLKINIPAKFVNRGHNSSPKIVGYQGIYRTGVDQTSEDEDDDEDDDEYDFYEIKLDVDGGVDSHNASPSYVYVSVDDANKPLKDFLPSDLHKGEASISQWTYETGDGQVVLEEQTVSEVVEKLGKNALKPIYYAQQEHVSTAADLQKAVYDAKGNKVIILTEDIQITDDLPDAAKNSELEKSYDNAVWGYYLSDNSSLGGKSIVIKSEDQSAPKTISLLKTGSGLLALQNARLTLENVIVDGLGAEPKPGEEGEKIEGTKDYIEIQQNATLILAQGSLIKDVYRKNAKVIFLNEGNLTIAGGYIKNCSVNYDEEDACGGAVYSSDGMVEMLSGGITDCCARTTKSGGAAFGGGIYAIKGSVLDLKGGIIIGCDIQGDSKELEIKSRGNAIYFEGNHASYYVEDPGGNLKINIPAGYDNTPYNLDARIVGYQGIYLKNITDGVVCDWSSKFKFYEILIDTDGGTDENKYHCGNAVYVRKDVKDTRILKYLPVYLEKGEFVLSGWYRGGEAVTDFAKIDHFLQEGSQNRTCVIRAAYKYRTDEVHVSNYAELQEALYNARGVKTIILDCDIEIDDSFKGIDKEIYPSAASGYCFSDDSGVSNKIVTIKSADGNKFKITNKKSDYGLLAIREGWFKFENVVLDGNDLAGAENVVLGGAGSSQDVNFIDVSQGAALDLGKGTEIKNVIGRSAVGLVGANLNILDGCVISDCLGVNGGAVNASSGSEVNMLGGLLTKCRAAASGGAIYAVDSSLNIQKGEISLCLSSKNGDAVYFSGGKTFNLASPNGDLKITIPLDNNSHNSCGKIFGYWGIYKEGIGDCKDHLQDEKYYELGINANGGVDRYGNFKINPVYISNEKPMSEISILKYLPTDLTKHGNGVIKWVHCLKDIDVTEDTKMLYSGLEYSNITFDVVKAIYDDVSFDDVFGGCLSGKECVYGDVYDLNAISKNGADGVKYEIVEGNDVAVIDGDKLKILGAGTFKLKATTQAATYTKSIGVKPKDLLISGIKPDNKEYDGTPRTTYTLDLDKTGTKFKTLKDAYKFILDNGLYDSDGGDENRALNVLKALGLDLVNAQDADILSQNLDKIVFAFADHEVGQDKNVYVKVINAKSAPAEFLNMVNNKYQLNLAGDCRASITEQSHQVVPEKDPEGDAAKDIDVVARLNNESEHAGRSIFNVLKDKDLENVSDKFKWFFKDKCEIEITPKDNSCAISKISHFKSPKSYLNISDLNKDAKWTEDTDGKSDGVVYTTSFAANGKVSRVLLNISKKEDSEKFFIYLKIVGKGGKVMYLRSDGIVLYNEVNPKGNEYKNVRTKYEAKDLLVDVKGVNLDDHKFYAIRNVDRSIDLLAKRKFLVNDSKSTLRADCSVFSWDKDGKHIYKVSYIPGCCEETEIEDMSLLPFFNLNVELSTVPTN